LLVAFFNNSIFCYSGSYYVYDNPSALQDVMKNDLKIDTAAFTNLYAVYSYPNVILCCFGGFLIDRVFGIRLGALLFCLLVTIGQVCADTLWNNGMYCVEPEL